MKKLPALNEEQQHLVVENLTVIHWAIHHFIKVNETICGFEYEDLYGEGCIWLCKAAATYQEDRGKFSAYAQTVVKNGLLSYCRITCRKHQHQRLLLDALIPEHESDTFGDYYAVEDKIEDLISALDADCLLEDVKQRYNGVTKLGIEAIQLKLYGYSGKDIALRYGVPQNHVGAWISRAAEKLQHDKPPGVSFLV